MNTYIPALRFAWLTPWYDAIVRHTTRERSFKRALIAQADIRAGQQVLDLAAGTGTLTIAIQQHQPAAQVIGVDGDPAILAIARAKAERAGLAVRFDQGLSYQLAYPAERFDRVVSSLFFHHLTWNDKQRTAAEVFRVLKPGAQLHVADWGRPANRLMSGLFWMIQILDGFKTTRDNRNGRLIELFEQAGFIQVAEQRSFGTMCGTLSLYRALKPA
jgi:ubiquinone/menaquinone biosynthesis C-methylase UbiE